MELYRKVYIIERKIKQESIISEYKRSAKRMKESKVISKRKYLSLISKFKKGWLCDDALSYAITYEEILNQYKEAVNIYPNNEYRIVLANCKFDDEYGISIDGYDYKIIEILPGIKKINFFSNLKSLILQNLLRVRHL